jgi:hypothetical protein
MAFAWSLCFLCTTYGFSVIIILSLYYLRLSFGHCIVPVLLTTFVWSLYYICTTYGFRLVLVLSLYYLRHSFGHYIVSVLLTASVCHCIVFVILTAFLCSLYCLCTTNGFRLVILLSLYYLWLSFGHCIVSVLLTLSFGHCIVSVLLMAFAWSLYFLCTTYGFRLGIILSLYYLRL